MPHLSRFRYIIGFTFLITLVMAGAPMAQSQTNQEFVAPVTYDPAQMTDAWETWKARYVTNDGAGPAPRLRVLNENLTTVSEGQAYGILLASIFDEQTLLDNLWMFAADHLNQNGLMHWNIASYGNLAGSGAASDADFDIALGMIYACLKVERNLWPASTSGYDYCQIAQDMIDAIWQHEIDFPGASTNGGLDNNPGYEIMPGDFWDLKGEYPDGITNLSYFSPAYFRIFAQFTGNDEWNRVIERQYELAEQTQTVIADNCSGLVPNWSTYNADYQYVDWHGPTSEYFGWDGARFAWRVALDRHWFNSAESNIHMNRIGGFFSSIGASAVRAEYRLDGTPVNSYGNAFFVANAASAIWAAADPTPSNCGQASGELISDAQDAYNALLRRDDNIYYEDSWKVLSMALMTGQFINPYNVGVAQPTPQPTPTRTGIPQLPTQTPTSSAPQNQAPILITIPPQSSAEGATVELAILADDPEGDGLRYDALDTLPPGLRLNPETGVISGTVEPNSAFTYLVLIEVSDSNGNRSSTTFDWEITVGEATSVEPAAPTSVVPVEPAAPTSVAPAIPTAIPATAVPLPDADSATAASVAIVARRDDTFNTQEAQFAYRLSNTGNDMLTDMSVRVYFTPDASRAAQDYVLDLYYDSSRSAQVDGPIEAGATAYFTIRYSGTLFPSASWEYQGSLHLNDWQNDLDVSNDWWVGDGLTESFAPIDTLPVYVGGDLLLGTAPEGGFVAVPDNESEVAAVPEPTQPPIVLDNAAPESDEGVEDVLQADVSVSIRANGPDDSQQTQFAYTVSNNGAINIDNVSVRVYYQPDGGRSGEDYTLELYWDSTQAARLSGPFAASDGLYYFSIDYGAEAVLFPSASWEYNGGLHLNDWSTTFSSQNDYWRRDGLPESYATTQALPVYSNDVLIAGQQP